MTKYYHRETIENMMECYRNRFSGSYIQSPAQRVSVYWGHYSIVEAELICLTDLMESGRNWSYAIDMAGSEVMMSTNSELVDDIRDQTYWSCVRRRWKKLGEHDPPPFNLTIYKGAKSWRLTRKFVNFLLNHPVSQTFLSIRGNKT